ILATALRVRRHHRERRDLWRPAALLVFLVFVQLTLGGLVVLSGLQPFLNTAHVVNGALVLGTSVVLTLRSFRPLFDWAPVRDPRHVVPAGSPLGARS